jgi:transposase-like protein
MYQGYLQRMLGRPGEYDRLNEHTLRRLSESRARAREAARHKLTQADVAEELGVDRSTIYKWFRKLKDNNMVYEPRHDPPSEYDGVVEARLRRLIAQEQGEGVADAIDHTQAAFILGVGYGCMNDRLRSFKRHKGRYASLGTTAINNVLKSLASASSFHSATKTSCYMADDGDSVHSQDMRKRRKTHDSYHHRHENDADSGDNDGDDDDKHDDDDADDDADDDDELCHRLAYQPNCSLPSVVDDRIPTRTEHHITTMYRGYLQRMLGRPGAYDRLNEHTLRRLVAAREAARQELTQADVAEELGVGRSTISDWLRKLKKNNMVYEPQHDPPSEYDGVVEARLRRLVAQEHAIDYTQAEFILGVSHDCMRKRLERFRRNKSRYTPLKTQGINNVLNSLRLAGESCDPEAKATYDAENVNNSSQTPSIRKKRKRDDTYTESPRLGAQTDHHNYSAAGHLSVSQCEPLRECDPFSSHGGTSMSKQERLLRCTSIAEYIRVECGQDVELQEEEIFSV